MSLKFKVMDKIKIKKKKILSILLLIFRRSQCPVSRKLFIEKVEKLKKKKQLGVSPPLLHIYSNFLNHHTFCNNKNKNKNKNFVIKAFEFVDELSQDFEGPELNGPSPVTPTICHQRL